MKIHVLGVFLYKYRGCLKRATRSSTIYQLIIAAYLVYLAIIPIAYGFHIYDWKIVPINNADLLSTSETDQQSFWLLGEFGGKYVFLKKQGVEMRGIIETVDTEKLERLSFDAKRADSLKFHMTGRTADNYKDNANETLDAIFSNAETIK